MTPSETHYHLCVLGLFLLFFGVAMGIVVVIRPETAPKDRYTMTSQCPDGTTKTATAWSKEEGEKTIEFECGEGF